MVELKPFLFDIVLPKLCKTGRFLWSLDGWRDAADSSVMAWDADRPWDLELAVTEDTTHQVWKINGRLRRGDEIADKKQVLFIQQDGWIFQTDRVGRIADSAESKPWMEIGLQNEIEIPFQDRADFLGEFAELAPSNLSELPKSLNVRTATPNPVGHFSMLSSTEDGRTSIGASLFSSDSLRL